MTQNVILESDTGWHLSTGRWMVEHGTVPTTDPFSLYGQGKPWVAYSWLFELIVYRLVQTFGMVGLLIYTVTLSLGITFALFTLIRKIEQNVSIVIGLTALGIIGMAPLLQTPRPWLFTILLFIIELDILLTARRTGNYRYLIALPFLFALWANLHIQFIYGLFTLVIFSIDPLIEQALKQPFSFSNVKSAFNTRQWLIVLSCFVATLATPYHIHLYETVIDTMGQTEIYQYINELQSMSFRWFPDWVVLGLILGATLLLGQKTQIKPFPILMLITGIFISFRSMRDVWFVVLPAIIIIASVRPAPSIDKRIKIKKSQMLVAFIISCLVVIFFVHHRKLTENGLNDAVAKVYPAAAVEIVKTRGYTGSLYNYTNWGGYLIWHLPQLLVSMDGRTQLHGEERIEKSLKTWRGAHDWADNSELAQSKLVIAQINMPLASLLRFDQRFNLVYEDSVAAVFIAKPVLSK
ncbi:hypothetical protein BCS42_05505 [Crenothrix sp. D3]|nr:hypothetical protein BCS42_05505 [Crenothrix sp. D3]